MVWPRNIAPRIGINELEKEPFPDWYARVRHLIPHVPSNVAEHWIHRHWGHSPYEFLPLAQLRFEQQTWTLKQLADIEFGWRWTFDLARLDRPHVRRTTLAQMMMAGGTWPQPIIVLDNVNGLRDGDNKPMGRLHLVEGHLRLTYLRCLEHKRQALPQHEVWITRLVP